MTKDSARLLAIIFLVVGVVFVGINLIQLFAVTGGAWSLLNLAGTLSGCISIGACLYILERTS